VAQPDAAARKAVEAVWRIEAARLIGGLVRLVRDVDRAEDLAQEALLAALERWPASGIPDNPGAWLMATARNRAVDEGRRAALAGRSEAELELAAARAAPQDDPALDAPVQDDVLRLMLLASHPLLSREARVALTLRLVAGLSTAEIARAYLTQEATIAQRIVRAKRTLAEAKAELDLPSGAALRERLSPTLEAIYLVFNEGYAATSGEDWIRRELCDEALRLGRVLVGLVPEEAEVHGLVALMELQASRLHARVGPRGEPVLLFEQDRARWDRLLITRGLAALERAEALQHPLGMYTLQAAIAGCHARARAPQETDWPRIVALYDALVELSGSPVVELNRAVAVAMAFGPAQGLELVDELAQDAALQGYHLLPAVRGDLLLRLGRRAEAKAEIERAAGLATNARERELLLSRAASCDSPRDETPAPRTNGRTPS
jgi:RNA polymerase sigma-70 factor (ECF subfamily)